MSEKRVFFLYSSSGYRRLVDQTAQSYLLAGMDRSHSLNIVPIDDFDRIDISEHSFAKPFVNWVLNLIWAGLGGSGGDVWKVLAVRRKIRSAEWVLSQVDRVGIPLVILSHLRIIPRRKILYISMGLSERLKKMSTLMKRFYLNVFNKRVRYLVCYGYAEYEELTSFFTGTTVEVIFVPFGVDTERLSASTGIEASLGDYLITVGRDPNRDYGYLAAFSHYTSRSIFVVSNMRRSVLAHAKDNAIQVGELPFSVVIELIRHSRAVILPVRNNSYSGATTTLMLAFALGKAVFVTPTDAIKTGYGLRHMHNCIFLSRSDPGFLSDVSLYIEDDRLLTKLGENARKVAVDYRKTYDNILKLMN